MEPSFFKKLNASEKEALNTIRAIAKTIPEFASLISDGSTNIVIEVDCDKFTEQIWDIFDSYNKDLPSLTIGFSLKKNNMAGERFL